jgi:cytidine deaminase
MVDAARKSMAHSYSPYSRVRVGAVLLAEDGRVFGGCNVENASYGMTWCAERTALVKAVSEGARKFKALAVVTDLQEAIMPCGACRQALHEFAPYLRIVVEGTDGSRYVTRLDHILPEAFGPEDLRQPRDGR